MVERRCFQIFLLQMKGAGPLAAVAILLTLLIEAPFVVIAAHPCEVAAGRCRAPTLAAQDKAAAGLDGVAAVVLM
jgi:hypothetical protein